jgi:hypothetical protein
MPHTYVQDVKKVISALTRDDGLILEEKLILLNVLTDHLTEVTKQLEDELAASKGGLVH